MRSAKWALIRSDWCPCKRRLGHIAESSCEDTGKRSHLQARGREASEKTSLADPLVSDVQPPEAGGNAFLLFKSVLLCYCSPSKRIQCDIPAPASLPLPPACLRAFCQPERLSRHTGVTVCQFPCFLQHEIAHRCLYP